MVWIFTLNSNKYDERNSFPYGETIAHDKRYTTTQGYL
jgi:hypothetical protein